MTVCVGIAMYSMQNGIDSEENRNRALRILFATHTPGPGGVGVQLPVEESRRRPATGAMNLNCMTATNFLFFFPDIPMELGLFPKVLNWRVGGKSVLVFILDQRRQISLSSHLQLHAIAYISVCATINQSHRTLVQASTSKASR